MAQRGHNLQFSPASTALCGDLGRSDIDFGFGQTTDRHVQTASVHRSGEPRVQLFSVDATERVTGRGYFVGRLDNLHDAVRQLGKFGPLLAQSRGADLKRGAVRAADERISAI